MKQQLRFNFVIDTNDGGLKKFLEGVQNKPGLTQDIARGFGSLICLGFGWNAEDEVGISNFTIGKPQPEVAEVEQKS